MCLSVSVLKFDWQQWNKLASCLHIEIYADWKIWILNGMEWKGKRLWYVVKFIIHYNDHLSMIFDGNNTKLVPWYHIRKRHNHFQEPVQCVYLYNVFIHDLNDFNEFLMHNLERRHCVQTVDLKSVFIATATTIILWSIKIWNETLRKNHRTKEQHQHTFERFPKQK